MANHPQPNLRVWLHHSNSIRVNPDVLSSGYDRQIGAYRQPNLAYRRQLYPQLLYLITIHCMPNGPLLPPNTVSRCLRRPSHNY
jgi:hypothetical protein